MQKLMALGLALGLAILVGCNTSNQGGKKDPDTPKKETFTITAPTTATTIKQGNHETVKLKVNRGKEFKQDITFSAEAPKGLSVTFDPSELKASDSTTEVKAKVEAAKTAPVGDHKVKVIGKPASGDSASVEFTVKVKGEND